MNGQALVDLTVAKVVPITDQLQVANVNEAFVLAAVNEAYRTVERSALWKYSEAEATLSLVPNQREYVETTDIAADLVTILHVYDAALRHELDFLDERQSFHDYGINTATTGVPEAWSRWNNNFIIHPTPSAARDLTIRYYASWADLTLATEPVFPAMYHDLLTDHAAYTLAMRLPPTGDRFLPGSRANPYLTQFAAKLQQMLTDPRTLVTQDEVINHDWERYLVDNEDW